MYSVRSKSSMHTTKSVIANGIAGKTKQSRRLRQTTEASEDEQTADIPIQYDINAHSPSTVRRHDRTTYTSTNKRKLGLTVVLLEII